MCIEYQVLIKAQIIYLSTICNPNHRLSSVLFKIVRILHEYKDSHKFSKYFEHTRDTDLNIGLFSESLFVRKCMLSC